MCSRSGLLETLSWLHALDQAFSSAPNAFTPLSLCNKLLFPFQSPAQWHLLYVLNIFVLWCAGEVCFYIFYYYFCFVKPHLSIFFPLYLETVEGSSQHLQRVHIRYHGTCRCCVSVPHHLQRAGLGPDGCQGLLCLLQDVLNSSSKEQAYLPSQRCP